MTSSSSDQEVLPWFAIYVKNRPEKIVARSLESKGYECFLPTYVKRHDDYKKFELPVFPKYVFCRLESRKPLPVLSIPGVFSIVGNNRTLTPIPDAEVEGIRRMVASGLFLQRWPYIFSGQEICITSGPLRGLQGIVVSENHQRWVVLSVNLLQRSIAVKVEPRHLTES